MIDISYLNYHYRSALIGDIDPQNPALKYICKRFELNLEQRYWLAFLFGCTYCAPTVYYIYNEFPDFENVDVNRLSRWWDENKDKCLFQTDRLRIKTSNKFVEAFCSYKQLIGRQTQHKFFSNYCSSRNKEANYIEVFQAALHIKHFGRFSNFIYLELLYELAELPIEPNELDIKNAQSCLNGLCYALDRESYIDQELSDKAVEYFERAFKSLCKMTKASTAPNALSKHSAWGVETTLCAYKKHRRGKRWIGYYIDRQGDEIRKMEQSVTEGVNWKPLWDFRKEFYDNNHLWELTGKRSSLEEPYL